MSNQKNRTVFIVDDNVRNLQVAGNILKIENYRVLFADNPKEGIKNIEKYMPDIILLDIMMPEIDGYEMCRLLKNNEKTKDIPIIFLTAKTEPESLSRGFEMGAVDYITKPFNSKELLARINTHITIQEQKHVLNDINLTKDKLFSVLGHDLRGNLASILSISELLLDDNYNKDDAQLKQFYRFINNQANNLNIILTNVLDWSKTRDNKIMFDPRKIDVKKLAETNVKMLRENAGLKEITLKADIQESLLIEADENMINTVLRNLIFNAIKFTNPGGNIFVRVNVKDNMAILKVIDTGVGIRKEKQDKIFSGETVISTRGTAEETGTGLGLILSKEFVKRNKGEIWLESEEGKGTTIFFSVPLWNK